MAKPSYFSKIFGSSPVHPLQEHIDKVVLCVELLVPYFEAAMQEDWNKAAAMHSNIEDLENEADTIKNKLRLHLPSSLFMPVDRRDILDVLLLQDHIANKAKDISGLILGRKMTLPEVLHEPYMNLLSRCIDAAKLAKVAVYELDELVATGFRGDEARRVKAMISDLHKVEDETDQFQIKLRSQLYTIEREHPPIDVMFIYEIIKWTGDLADIAQSAGNRIQLMLAK